MYSADLHFSETLRVQICLQSNKTTSHSSLRHAVMSQIWVWAIRRIWAEECCSPVFDCGRDKVLVRQSNERFIYKREVLYYETVSVASFQHRSRRWTRPRLRQKRDTSLHPYCEGGAQQPNHSHLIFGANHYWDISSLVISWDHMSVNQRTTRCVCLTPWGTPPSPPIKKHNDSWT